MEYNFTEVNITSIEIIIHSLKGFIMLMVAQISLNCNLIIVNSVPVQFITYKCSQLLYICILSNQIYRTAEIFHVQFAKNVCYELTTFS